MKDEAVGGRYVPPELYTAREVAQLFRVGPSAVYTWIKQGKMFAYSTPTGRIRIPAEEVERLLREQCDRGYGS